MMDSGHHRGTWKSKSCFLFLSVCLSVCISVAGAAPRVGGSRKSPNPCKGDEFRSKKGFCCNKCPPGYKLVAECEGPGLRSNCSICPDGQFLEETNSYRNCFRCRTCNSDNHEKVAVACSPTKNTVCECEDGFTRRFIDGRTSDCEEQPEEPDCEPPYEEPGLHWSFIIGMGSFAVLIMILASIGILKFHKRVLRRVAGPRRPLDPSPAEKPSEKLLKMDSGIQESDLPSMLPGDNKPSPTNQLPDCIPQEIKFSPFVYFLLDHVPADRFKELVRHLGVSERDIERAERDNRSFKEGQHQMLKVWGESGAGGVRGILPQPQVVELLDTLRMMGLGGSAEAIQEKYDIQ
ncbi:hypothetical protein GJAV_G00006510 [Gymnothorax javanicus]|nr:hypothetical protein GJAV_G00006510 [Gymnothorax javanicus]